MLACWLLLVLMLLVVVVVVLVFVRHGVGLPTRAGTARFIVRVVTQVGADIRPVSGPLLKVRFYFFLSLCATSCSR